MQNSSEIIDAVRNKLVQQGGSGSDYAIAGALHISRQSMSKRRRGLTFTMDDETATRAADFLGLPRPEILAIVHLEQSERAGEPEAAATWREIVEIIRTGKRAAAATGLFILGAVLAGTLYPAKTAYAATDGAMQSPTGHFSLYIMLKRLAAILRGFRRYFAPILGPVFA